ncbi:hypothetical protein [Azospirillum argentinense]|uniref:hypothetical protein n=1 Tax=Azospirillum argentinense TaxID=2970906 RepID=UPI0032DF68F4
MPEDAHHRFAERRELKRLLLAGDNALLLAPRRVGKTWMMKRLDDDLTEAGHLCIRIDVEGIRNEEGFLRTLCQEIDRSQDVRDTVKSYFTAKVQQLKTGLSGDSVAQMIGKMDPRVFSETLIGALNQRTPRTLVMIDEFSLFILELAKQDPDGTRALLYHLRRLQQEFPNVGWLLTGSVGLDVVARRFNLEGALLDFVNVSLDPFTAEEARSYLAEQAALKLFREPFEFGDGAFERLVEDIGWLSPYYLNHTARHIRPTGAPVTGGLSGGCAVATPDDVDRALAAILAPNNRLYFSPWKEHIEKNFPVEEAKRLHAILARCCEGADGEVEDTLLGLLVTAFPDTTRRNLKDHLTSLESDGFLIKDGGRWRFRSGLLRRYWLEYIA